MRDIFLSGTRLACGALILSVIHVNAYAAETQTTPFLSNSSDNSWFMGIGAGPTWIGLPSSTTVLNGASVPPPNNQDKFTINNPSGNMYQYIVGYRWHQDNQYIPYYQWFLQYRYYGNIDVQGTVDQYSLPGFVNYYYQMRYDATLLSLNGKLNVLSYKQFMPYVLGGVGVIFNHLHDYSEIPTVSVTPRTNPAYNGNTSRSFAWTLGLGIDYQITDTMWATLGYDHVFQGDIKSGPGAGSWSSTKLSIGNVKMDTLFINLSVKFPCTF